MVLGLKKFPSCRGVPAGRGGIALCFALLLFGCAELERNRFYEGDNYGGQGDSSSSSSGYAGSYGSLPYEDQTYKTVVIGTQTWMAENLNYNADGSKCYYNNSNSCDTYGRLYDWATAMAACPDGWHLPSDAEWTVLTNYAGGSLNAGTKLKATSGWYDKGNGTDELGFSALPGGYGLWWSSSESGSDSAYRLFMYYDDNGVYRDYDNKYYFFSVRCVED